MTSALRARHATLYVLGLIALVLIFVGCDTDSLDRDRDDPVVNNDVRVATFTLGDTDNRGDFRFGFEVDGDFVEGIYDEVQYETDDRSYPAVAGLLTPQTVNEGLVLLYVSDVVSGDGLTRSGWTPLPLALGFDERTEDLPMGDGFVDYVLTTTYTYDVDRLYVNLIASDLFTLDFLDRTEGLLADIEDIRFRLVTIPGGGFTRSTIDFTDYKAVQRAYNLPD
jgi:hypothetical protein